MKSLQKFFDNGMKKINKESSEFDKKFNTVEKRIEKGVKSMEDWSQKKRIIRNK